MADKDSIDVLMTFIDKNGNGVAAEGTSKWDKDDTDMMKDFQDGKFFEVDDFTFGFNLGGNEARSGESGSSSSSRNTAENVLHSRDGKESNSESQKTAQKAAQSSEQFDKYIETGEIKFKAKPETITVTRQMDIASVRFLQSCVNYTPFQKAVLVKRKFTGGFDFHEAYLRLEFQQPLIVGVEWDEGDVVKEKLKFVYRGIVVAYRPQNPDGTLGDARSANWTPQRKLAGG
jgi:type VI protein secretion system component Hcp